MKEDIEEQHHIVVGDIN